MNMFAWVCKRPSAIQLSSIYNVPCSFKIWLSHNLHKSLQFFPLWYYQLFVNKLLIFSDCTPVKSLMVCLSLSTGGSIRILADCYGSQFLTLVLELHVQCINYISLIFLQLKLSPWPLLFWIFVSHAETREPNFLAAFPNKYHSQ